MYWIIPYASEIESCKVVLMAVFFSSADNLITLYIYKFNLALTNQANERKFLLVIYLPLGSKG